MSKMAEFVEDHLIDLDDLPENCTRNLLNKTTFRAEQTLHVRERGDEQLFLIIRFSLTDTGKDRFEAQLSLHQWHPDNGITGSDRLAIDTQQRMTESIRSCLGLWRTPIDVIDAADNQQFLRYVATINEQLGDYFTDLRSNDEAAND